MLRTDAMAAASPWVGVAKTDPCQGAWRKFQSAKIVLIGALAEYGVCTLLTFSKFSDVCDQCYEWLRFLVIPQAPAGSCFNFGPPPGGQVVNGMIFATDLVDRLQPEDKESFWMYNEFMHGHFELQGREFK